MKILKTVVKTFHSRHLMVFGFEKTQPGNQTDKPHFASEFLLKIPSTNNDSFQYWLNVEFFTRLISITCLFKLLASSQNIDVFFMKLSTKIHKSMSAEMFYILFSSSIISSINYNKLHHVSSYELQPLKAVKYCKRFVP